MQAIAALSLEAVAGPHPDAANRRTEQSDTVFGKLLIQTRV
jgi:hypothetical protein